MLQWYIEPPLGENMDSEYRIVIPWQSKDLKFIASAVSQDVVQHPDEVSLIKNLQVWSFEPVPHRNPEHLYAMSESLDVFCKLFLIYNHQSSVKPLLRFGRVGPSPWCGQRLQEGENTSRYYL